MKKTLKIQLIDSIERIYLATANSKLDEAKLGLVDKEIGFFCKYLKCNKIQALLVAVIFIENLKDRYCEPYEICRHFDITPIKLIKYKDEIDELIRKNLIALKSNSRSSLRRNRIGESESFFLNPEISDAIIMGKTIAEKSEPKLKTALDIFEKVGKLFNDYDKSIINSKSLATTTTSLFQEYTDIPLINKINGFNLNKIDLAIFSKLIWATICGGNNLELHELASVFHPNEKDRFLYVNSYFVKSNRLVKNDLVEFEEIEFFSNTSIKLTNKTIDLLADFEMKLKEISKPDNIVGPDAIATKQLFYPESLSNEISVISSFFNEEKRIKLRQKLQNKSLSVAMSVLFYGSPGTGKTETVYQLAKSSGREIMHIDISQVKSMWFGESEKTVKKIFKDYKNYCRKCKQIPILLFNEADAIFSKRKDIGRSNTAQTENAIQNIILEEMEKFDGILVATTNMTENLDAAFERRFLFKVKFNPPDVQTKTKIWKSKMPELSEIDCLRLAEKFDLSGAQIDNVVKKCQMFEILNNSSADIKQIESYCVGESTVIGGKKRVKIGY